ncbi:MAG: hypothetical protein HYR67_04290 [Bacteroidetes bacterium]|nr:hypothetical protein [Bacteroidota bacterium]
MIRIKPEPENHFFCPKCSQKPVVREIVMQSVFTLADCKCENCGIEFLQTLPVSHTVIDTLTIDKSEKKLYAIDTGKSWLSEALLKAHCSHRPEEVRIKKIIYKKHDHVVVLNTLDFLYGHVLLKLYNSIYHLDHQKDLGLIVIIPKLFEWLVPGGCAETWIVDLKLNDLAYNYSYIQKFVSKEFERFNTVYLSKAYSHPNFSTIDIARFTGIRSFDLTNFTQLRPTFTFVLREDRWWLRGPLDYWFYRLCRKLGTLKMGSRVLSMRQNKLVKKTLSLILEKLPGANFYIVGLGAAGNFKGRARDERKRSIDDSVERDWCRIYAQSHVVIGVHGSNMLLPTAHAAGCVEILPEDRYGNIVQDISVRYADRKQLYFYRFADQYAHPKTVANKVISIIENFELFEKNMSRNVYPAKQEPLAIGRLRDDIYAIH